MSSQTLTPALAPRRERTAPPRVDIIDFGLPIERPLPITRVPAFVRPAPLRLVPAPPQWAPATVRGHLRPAEPSALKLTRRGRVALVAIAFLVMLLGFSLGNDVSLASPAPATPVIPAGAHTVIVQPGDTLWAIASKLAPKTDPRVTVQRIISLNKLPNAELAAGERLALPS